MESQRSYEAARNLSDIAFTNHALERMKLRRISREMIIAAIQKPDEQRIEEDGDTRFIRTIESRPLHVVSAYLDDEKKWLIKSVWVRGEEDPLPFWKRVLQSIWRFISMGGPANRRRRQARNDSRKQNDGQRYNSNTKTQKSR